MASTLAKFGHPPVLVLKLKPLLAAAYNTLMANLPHLPLLALKLKALREAQATASMAKRLEPYEKKEAQERQRQAGIRGQEGGRGHKKAVPETLTGSSRKGSQPKEQERAKGRTAKAVEVDRRTLEKIEVVAAAAKKDPERYGPVAKKMDETGKVDGA